MQNFVIASSSTADFPLSYFTQHNIPYLCYTYTIDGVDYPDDFFETRSPEDFYGQIAAGTMPTTSQVNIASYREFFEPFLAAGQDVLFLDFPLALSGSYQNAVLAARELREKYPERKLYVVDSLAISGGQAMLLDEMIDLRDGGASLEEIHDWIAESRVRLQHWGFTTDLTHFKRGGRISGTAAVIGGALSICPILVSDDEGHLLVGKKVRGKKNALREMLAMMEKHAENGHDYSGKCFICHANCAADAKELADLIAAQFPKTVQPVIVNIGCVIGSHTGPGSVAFFFWGDKRNPAKD